MDRSQGIRQSALVELARAGSIRKLQAVRAGNGRWALVASVGMEERTLASQRETVRLFADLNRMARFIRETLGINRFEVVES